jgi:hypothetical protein
VVDTRQVSADEQVELLLIQAISNDVKLFTKLVLETLQKISEDVDGSYNISESLLPEATYNEIATIIYKSRSEITNKVELDLYLINIMINITQAVVDANRLKSN